MTTLREAAQQALQDAPRPRPDGTYRVEYRCEECGHVQYVTEMVNDGSTYVGSGAMWCDECGDGLPLRVEPEGKQ